MGQAGRQEYGIGPWSAGRVKVLGGLLRWHPRKVRCGLLHLRKTFFVEVSAGGKGAAKYKWCTGTREGVGDSLMLDNGGDDLNFGGEMEEGEIWEEKVETVSTERGWW